MTILKNNGIRIKHAVIFLSPIKKKFDHLREKNRKFAP